jgi:hypothetical protein
MKYFIPVVSLLVSLLFSCRSFDDRLLINKESIDKDIKPMKVIVNYESIQTCLNPVYIIELNEKQIIAVIKNNLRFEKDAHNHYLSILVKNVEHRESFAGSIVGGLTGLSSIILGVPMLYESLTVHLSAAIMSADGKILKTYEAEGADSEYAALWWGYFRPGKTAGARAITNACRDLRIQLKNDAQNINMLVK